MIRFIIAIEEVPMKLRKVKENGLHFLKISVPSRRDDSLGRVSQ